VTRTRLDLELVRRGLVATEQEALDLIRAGRVLVGGSTAVKPETLVAPAEAVSVEEEGGPHVSRGGTKLAAALDRFRIDVRGRRCLDAGASTGGFTDVLLARGAARVVAVDVGYGQLAWKLRTDDRVVVMERTNIRDVRPEDLPYAPDVVTGDLSFISLGSVLKDLVALAAPKADLVVLVKPQFEAARSDVSPGGVVRDRSVWRSSLASVATSSSEAGAEPLAAMASPLPGPSGNVEYFLHARVGAPPTELDLEGALREGEALASVKGAAS
jgi:23S rRNA (cytidine1920-2'-O)/16S rRNA (cytidine1409-2'-O)-methyltransferase